MVDAVDGGEFMADHVAGPILRLAGGKNAIPAIVVAHVIARAV